jgi:hypothetical protein
LASQPLTIDPPKCEKSTTTISPTVVEQSAMGSAAATPPVVKTSAIETEATVMHIDKPTRNECLGADRKARIMAGTIRTEGTNRRQERSSAPKRAA